MQILITNVYSYQNKGDAAIVLALLREINRVFKRPDIIAQTVDAENDAGKYGVPVTHSLLWLLLSSVRKRSIIIRLFILIYGVIAIIIFLQFSKIFGLQLTFLLPKNLKRFIKYNKEADLVIGCGGGYLRTPSGSWSNTILLGVTCLNFLAPKYLGKPVYLYSQSIGPVHGRLQTILLRFALNRVDIIEPREEVSLKYLQSLNLSSSVIRTADPALLLGNLSDVKQKTITSRVKKFRVGLTVRKWFNTEQEFDDYIAAMAKVVDYLVEEYNAEVFYIPQVIAEKFGDDDRIAAFKVKEKVKHKDDFNVIEDDLHPFEIISLCGSMDVFIGTRMHSNIFALISKVPVVAIEYEHKTRGIMRDLGLEHLTVAIEEAQFPNLKEKVDDLIKNCQQYKQTIIDNLPLLIKKGQLAIEVIKDDYEQNAKNLE